jgi:N-dimethylarginine dimethylaminohydrolase
MKQIVMAPPDKFGVQYEINAWMKGNVDTVDVHKAAQQWSNLRNMLVQVGVDVIVMPSPPLECPDAVFTANAGLIYKDIFIPSQFEHPERQAEEPYFIEYFERKFHLNPINEESDGRRLSFEGAGDALFSKDRKRLFMGFGFRTHGDAKFALDYLLEQHETLVVPLRLVDPRWYHLDTAFCPLDTGEVLWYPDAFDKYSQSIIEAWYPGDMNIKVSEEDALQFACNAVSVGESIVMPKQTDDLFFNLMDRGYKVHTVDMSQFLRSGGACKCLTLEVIE